MISRYRLLVGNKLDILLLKQWETLSVEMKNKKSQYNYYYVISNNIIIWCMCSLW